MLLKRKIMNPMSLVTPAIGLIFWTSVVFILLLILLKKFAWSPILNAVDERNKNIEESLKLAEKAKEEMSLLNADNERILTEAKNQRDSLLKEARVMKQDIISEAKKQANTETERMITAAREQISNEKKKALTELKNQVAEISINIAEKILKEELTVNKHKEIIARELENNKFN
jgi:F-type H+-transporting ATPase subunit b